MKILDKLINNIKFDKKYVLFSIILVILGIITGSIFIVILNSTDKTLVIEYITSFVDNIKNSNINSIDILKNTLLSNYILIFIIIIIGLTSFFFFINIIILFYKSFVIGFSLSSFIITYGIKGILLSIVYIIPHLIINILIFCLLTSFTVKKSINMIKYIIRKKDVNMRLYFNKFFSLIILSIIIISITGIYESYIMPYLVKFVIMFL